MQFVQGFGLSDPVLADEASGPAMAGPTNLAMEGREMTKAETSTETHEMRALPHMRAIILALIALIVIGGCQTIKRNPYPYPQLMDTAACHIHTGEPFTECIKGFRRVNCVKYRPWHDAERKRLGGVSAGIFEKMQHALCSPWTEYRRDLMHGQNPNR